MMKADPIPPAEAARRASTAAWSGLVDRIRSSEPCAMEELYRMFFKGVRFFIYRHLGPEDIEDKVHDVFVIITEAIQHGELREPEKLMGYVRTIVRRQIAAHIDAAVEARRTRIDVDFSSSITDLRPDPERAAIESQNKEVVMRILHGFPPRDRDVLTRFYLEEQSPDQICRELKLTTTQFRLVKSRAKARFGELGKRSLKLSGGFPI
jgi:RNA polymerase sigma factor (sigma-70 family)